MDGCTLPRLDSTGPGEIQITIPYRSYFSKDIILANFADSEPSMKVVGVVNVHKVGVTRSLSAKYKTANMHWLFNREICIPRKIGPIQCSGGMH